MFPDVSPSLSEHVKLFWQSDIYQLLKKIAITTVPVDEDRIFFFLIMELYDLLVYFGY